MGKNILVVRGGGRPRGNTAQLAESFAKGDFALVNYIGFNDKGVLLAGGCGDTNGRPCIEKHRICKGHMSLEKIFTALVTVNK